MSRSHQVQEAGRASRQREQLKQRHEDEKEGRELGETRGAGDQMAEAGLPTEDLKLGREGSHRVAALGVMGQTRGGG